MGRATVHLDEPVLVLNQNYEPLNICNVRRALMLLFNGKAEVLELNHQIIHSATTVWHAPSVIRLSMMIKRPVPRAKLSRREIFIRDEYTCQYCGLRTRDLTLDHVVPKSKGGAHTWENLVSACRSCNHRKGGKSVAESNMRLAHEPRAPRTNMYYMVHRYLRGAPNAEWEKFVPGFSRSNDA
ncbi:MAG: HNH endonuclease [Candidatus Chloroheliales bacterium]|nr:MAG: HNH endonuclease [Chloroflexota bacterium]